MINFDDLWRELEKLREVLEEAGGKSHLLTSSVHPELRGGASNLIDYVSLRQLDLRPLQFELERHGLSSLGRMEGHVRDAFCQVRARVRDALQCEAGGTFPDDLAETRVEAGATARESEQSLHKHTRDLLGPRPHNRHIYVMVTAPGAAEVDEAWVTRLLEAGMNVLRINGAHESATEWERIALTARRVAAARNHALRVLVDLPGPKLRTVAARPGLRVVRWKPERDAFGRVRQPCQVAIHPGDLPAVSQKEPYLPVPREITANLVAGDELVFRDARGRSRRLVVAALPSRRLVANLRRTAYVVPGTVFEQRRASVKIAEFTLAQVPEQPSVLRLSAGERFWLAAGEGQAFHVTDDLPVVGCSWGAAVAALEPGARVIFDDGKIDCIVERCSEGGAMLKVTRAADGGTKLRAEKGINLPDTNLPAVDLTPADEAALVFAEAHADMVGLSFISGPESVVALYRRLERAKNDLGVVLKIETAAAFANFPAILLTAMTRYPVGVMIARGDLAIEVGFSRMAEVQEELLWFCEAARLPVIWATQVLDQLARDGVATRAEVTDAAMSVRAECVMLNKGPKIDAATIALVDILHRMEAHQYKKRSLYRKLALRLPTQPTT